MSIITVVISHVHGDVAMDSDVAFPTLKVGGAHSIKMRCCVYLCLLALLVSITTKAQRCQRITGNDLGSSDTPSVSGLIARSFRDSGGDNLEFPLVQLLSFHVVCEAAGSQRDTYRLVSLIANYTYNSQPRFSQFDYECTSENVWGTVVLGSNTHTITTPPDASYSTRPRQDCVFCVSSSRFSSSDPTTHCLCKFSKSMSLSSIQVSMTFCCFSVFL